MAPWAETPWRAWHELSGERAHAIDGYGTGMGAIRIVSRPLTIPWRAVREWCAWNLIRPEDRDLVLSGVQALDRLFVRWRNDRIDQEIRQALRGG